MFALASQATIAPIAAPLRARKAPKTALRRAAVRVNASSNAKSDDDRAMFSRRQLGLGSAALASLMATDMTVVNPAMAKKIISGKQDCPDIADVSAHPTPTAVLHAKISDWIRVSGWIRSPIFYETNNECVPLPAPSHRS